MSPLFGPLQLAFDLVLLGGLLWVWSRNRVKLAPPQPAPAGDVKPVDFEQVLQAEEAARQLHEALQAADARLRALRVCASAEAPPEPNHARSAVWALHRRGLDPRSIADELSLSQAEVRLVLSLENPQASRPPVDT
jgi:hypothetical protein